jgi:hypothetical protein
LPPQQHHKVEQKTQAPQSPQRLKKSFQKQGKSVFWREKEEKKRKKREY